MKIAFSVGHTPDNPGAKRDDINEYILSAPIIGKLIYDLGLLGHLCYLIGTMSNSKQVTEINHLNVDFGIELHFNSHTDDQMNGAECLHSGAVYGGLLAFSINTALCESLGVRDRGTHVGHYRLDNTKRLITMIRDTNCPFVIVEPLFLSNDFDFVRLNFDKITTGILNGINHYIRITE